MKSFMNKLNALFDKKLFRIVLLAVIIAAELTYTIFLFANEKHGQHSDEVWSYSIANDSKQFDFDGDDFLHRWQTTEQIRDYITVQPEERFHFDIPYKNNIHDLNPPLYYMIVHFICSFFPNQYSPWYAFSINIVSLIFTQIYLFLLSEVSFKEKRYMPFVVCLFYAVSLSSAATFIFMRMYAMMTALTVANLYYQVRVLQYDREKGLWKPVLGSFLTCYLGFMTHSIFPVIGGIATFMVCLWFLCHKQIKKCFGYGFVMLGSLALYAATFSAGVAHVFNTGEAAQTAGATYPFRSQFLLILSYMRYHLEGQFVSIFKGYVPIYISAAVICLVVISVPLCFLFRNEEWFKKLISNVKNFFVSFVKEKKFWKVFDYPFFIFAAVILAYVIVCAKVVNVQVMGDGVVRYTFCLFPLCCLCMAGVAHFVLEKIKYVKKAAIALTFVFVMAKGIYTAFLPNTFLFAYYISPDKYVDMYELFRGQRLQIYLLSGWIDVPYMPYVLGCEKVKFITIEDLLGSEDHGIDTSVTSEGSFLLLLPQTDPDLTHMTGDNAKDESMTTAGAEKALFGGAIHLDREDEDLTYAVTEEKLKDIYSELLERDDVHSIEYVCDAHAQGYAVCVYRVS